MTFTNNSPGIRWYLNRANKMPLPEIPYRLNQFFMKQQDKYFLRLNLIEPSSSDVPYLNLKNFENQIESQVPLSPTHKESILRQSEELLLHRFKIFGVEADFGSPIDFHLDPITGKTWPIRFWADINYRDGRAIGGIKFAWELNRLNHWPKLAIAYSLTNEQRYLNEIFKQLDQWLKSNPYPRGINWISGIELGIRIVNLFYSLKFLKANSLVPDVQRNILNFISLHARHLYRFPSKYSSCDNHALAEALGLFIAGVGFPFMSNAHKWKSFGKRILESEVSRQIYPDGSSFEHTIPYLQFIADLFLLYYLIAKEYEESLTREIEHRLKAICGFISCIVDIKGNIPMIGDDDSGYLLKIASGEDNNFLSLLNTCGILFNRPQWIHPAASLDPKTRFLHGKSAISRWNKLKDERSWRRKSCYFNNAGLAIIAHRKCEKEVLFVGNSGPLGLPPLGGHGHADALSFWLSINGQPIFVDPGTYLYHSGGKWRRFFRSTVAHNTIQIDEKDQSEQLSDFMFGDFYEIHGVHWDENDDMVFWGAEHDGYRRLADPVIHRREVTYLKEDHSFMIVDLLKCRGRHDVKLLFHLHPNVTVRTQADSTYRLSAGTFSIILRVDNKLQGQIFSGSEDPLMGWYSRGFNHLERTNSLVFKKNISGNSVLRSEVKVL